MKRTTLAILAVLSLPIAMISPRTAFANADSCGAVTAVNDEIISATAWDTLLSCIVNLDTDHSHHCVATACADAGGSPVTGTDNDYRFVLSTTAGGPGLDTGWERSVELNDNVGVDDPDSVPVCTTRQLLVSAGQPQVTLFWLARKVAASDANMTVFDSSLSVTCTDNT